MKPQVKYTHITERCSSIIKAFASLRIEQQTGDTVSAAYWRLREGKGLLTPFDKEKRSTSGANSLPMSANTQLPHIPSTTNSVLN